MIELLPAEIQSEIFSYLSSQDLYENNRNVSTQFRILSDLILLSRKDVKSLGYEDKLLAALARDQNLANTLPTRDKDILCGKLLNRIKSPAFRGIDRLHGLMTIGALKSVKPTIEDTTFNHLHNTLAASQPVPSIACRDAANYLITIAPMLCENQSTMLIATFTEKLSGKPNDIYDAALKFLTTNVSQLNQAQLTTLCLTLAEKLNQKNLNSYSEALNYLSLIAVQLSKEQLPTVFSFFAENPNSNDLALGHAALACLSVISPRLNEEQLAEFFRHFLKKLNESDEDWYFMRIIQYLGLNAIIPQIGEEQLASAIQILKEKLN